MLLRRREVITLIGGAAAWPLAARAQQSRKAPRIGVLLAGTPASFSLRAKAFVEGLQDLGYVEGKSIVIEWRWGLDRVDQLPELAAGLVRLEVDAIVTGGTPAAKALKNATSTIPIIMAIIGDPVAAGLVDSLARPGGNATGFSIVAPDLSGKRLQLLKELVPGMSTVAVMLFAANPQAQIELREMQIAARVLDLQLHPIPISAGDPLENAFDRISKTSAQALIVLTDPILFSQRSQLAVLAARNRLPSMHFFREFVEQGGLISYAPSDTELFRRAATYVDKGFEGRQPPRFAGRAANQVPIRHQPQDGQGTRARDTADRARARRRGDRVMRRRELITLISGAAAAWPLAARAQQPAGRPLIAVLSPLSRAMAARNLEAFRSGLHDLGYSEGRNIAIEYRFADGTVGRLPDLAAELVALKPAAIITGALPAVLAARHATRTIPIVMTAIVQDPVPLGLAASIARPGGNVTGFWIEGDEAMIGKRLELLKEAVPGTSRVGVIVNPDNPTESVNLNSLPAAGRALGSSFAFWRCARRPSSKLHLRPPLGNACRGCTFSQDLLFNNHRTEIAALAARARLPAVYAFRVFVTAGGRCPMRRAYPTPTDGAPAWWTGSSKEPIPATCRSSGRPNSSW
jgi:ABC-type uncharacterized transport system substrate-binding protein